MAYKIDLLNAITAKLGGTTVHRYNINALNEWCTLAGGSGGHKYDIDAYNELATIYTGSGGFKFDIKALNAIVTELGGTAKTYTVDVLSQLGALLNQALEATLTSTGTGAGVSTLRLEVSETQTLTLDGTARFYTNSAGTLGESTTWNVTAGALRTIYLKCPTGTANLTIPEPKKVIKWGSSELDGWVSSTNAASISIEVGKLALTELRIIGTSTLIGALPTGLTYLRLNNSLIAWTYTGALPTELTYLTLAGNLIAWTYTGALPTELTTLILSGGSIAWTYTGALPTELTYLYLLGNVINWTGLDVGNNGNIGTFGLNNYRITKMSSPDMVTLLTQLTNRTGTLPATITINDYADYASPPQAVTDAVAALKIAKSITTVNLGA